MIPKRSGDLNLLKSIPTGNGVMPLPDAAPSEVVSLPLEGAEVAVTTVGSDLSPTDLLEALNSLKTAKKSVAIARKTMAVLQTRKLVVTVGDYSVVSEKGLSYLIDFGLLT